MGIELAFVFFISLLICIIALPRSINSLSRKKVTVVDRYKSNQPLIPTQGAIVIFFSSIITVTIYPVLIRLFSRFDSNYILLDLNELDIALILVTTLYALFGVVDDVLDISWFSKLILPITFSFPLLVVLTPSELVIPFYGSLHLSDYSYIFFKDFVVDLSDIFKVIIIPIYIMVVANLINMNSGFNGLQSGLSLILMSTLVIKCILDDSLDNLISLVSIMGGLTVLLYYNFYPASIFEGNMGSLTFGSTLGVVLVIKGYYFFGIFILIPHIVDFLMWFTECHILKRKFNKFGELSNDGYINSPTPFKLKFFFPYYFRLNEKQIVLILWSLSSLFCVFALFLF